jgi:preprotein translocase subunit SecG
MTAFVTILIIIVCILLILIVLVQNSKGGGLASNFASSNQFMGVRKTADFLEKATWSLAGALLFLCLVSSASYKNKTAVPKSAIETQTINTNDPGAVPNFPNNAPTTGNKNTNAAPAQGTQNNSNTTEKK